MNAAANDFHGLELSVRSFSGAAAVRVVHPPRQMIDDHSHDWPCLTVPVLGAYTENHDGGSCPIAGPAAILHPPKSAHANQISARGLETFSIQFDPAWLGSSSFDQESRESRVWTSGPVVTAARRLAAIWSMPGICEGRARTALRAFMQTESRAELHGHPPSWLGVVNEALERDDEESVSTDRLAARLGLHPAWLARAYRQFRGEGLQDALRRRRMERAVELLRHSKDSPAEIACQVGFCDQSHMSRTFRTLIGRTPRQIRQEAKTLSDLREVSNS